MEGSDWGNHLRVFRRHRGLTQVGLARMMGVEQPTVSRWETGWLRPGPEARRRLREVVLAFDRRGDRAIVNSVRCADTPVSLVDLDSDRFVAVSIGFCRMNQIAPDTACRLRLRANVSDQARAAIGDRALVSALRGEEIAGVRIRGYAPRLGGGAPHRVSATITPFWLSDARCVLRVDDVLVPSTLPFATGIEALPLP